MKKESRIIVAHTFSSLIDANIVKTKLDAYGIPCFLTGENLTSLTTHLLSGGIELHIFEEDHHTVSKVIGSALLQKDDDSDLPRCPNCRSKSILRLSDKLLTPSLVVRLVLQLSKKHYCLDCETEFDH